MKGEVLGDRYQIQQQIGKRAGRRTFLARDEETQQLAIIKLLTFGSDFEWEHLKLFEREAETLKSLTHPAIPRYLDFFEVNSPNSKGFALVQTYIEAKSLEEHLKRGRTFSEVDIKQIATAILEILIYLHGRQPPVIHRDIKPSNILLTNRSGNNVGEVYLVDFGAVQTLAAKEGGTITVVGTYGYMPPEQFGGRAVPASDLYSLGATLIYLATGQHPADLPQTDNLQIEFEKTANLSPTLINWLKRMTHPSLNRRLNSAQSALQALKQKQLTTDSHPLAVKKPTGSKVSLTKNADTLEIITHPLGFNWQVAFASVSLPFLLALQASMIKLLFSPYSSFSFTDLFYGLLFTSLDIWFASMILFALFGRARLRIDQKQISLTYELFGLKFNRPRTVPRQNISKVELSQRRLKEGFWGNRVESERQLIIWAGVQKYALGVKSYQYQLGLKHQNLNSLYSSITEPEMEWLAQELSEWLEIPITRDYLPPAAR
jgi:serine/threonine protein kinase